MNVKSDLKVSEFAAIVGLKTASVRQLIRNGKLSHLCYKVGGTYRFRVDAVEKLREVKSQIPA